MCTSEPCQHFIKVHTMERAGRPELLKTIDAQKDQLQTYKNKLRDVVAAYKSVVIEKEALEASVAVLSSCSDSGGVPAVPDSNGSEGDGGNLNQPSTSDPLGVEAGEEDVKDELPSLKNQIKTLSTSLITITQEKNKIEANFIADKKQVKQEIEDLQQSLAKEKNRTSTQAEGFELQITDLKSRLRTQQLEREKDQTNHGLMLKELQMLVAKERMDKEQLTTQLEDAKKICKEKEEKFKITPSISESYERQIDELKRELMSVRDQMKVAEVKANLPSPFVLELQQEMTRVKETHQRQLTQEQMKASESELKIQSQANQSEERVSSLEEKLSELSRVVGNYERLKFQDQQAMSKLRERVTQLDLENTALVHAAKLTYGNSESMEENLSADEILNKIMHFRELLISASESEMSDTPIKMSSIFVKDLNKSDEESSICKQYKNQLEKVKEEFERYKLRAQSVLKTKNKDNSSVAELDSLKEQNSDLRNKLRMSNSHHNEEIVQFQIKVDNLSKALLAQEEKGKLQISEIKSFHQKEISQLQLEVKKQRDRSLALLSEKDQQIQRMMDWRDVHPGVRSGAGVDSFHADILERDGNSGELSKQSEEVQAIHKLLNLPKEVENEAFIHFAQEKARADVDVSTLRKQKRDLEMALRESYAEAKQTERQLKDELSVFKNHSAEMERQSYREGANMEYLKNVLLKFFTSTDWEGKKRMVKALMTILQFSPQESQQVQQVYNKGWWGS